MSPAFLKLATLGHKRLFDDVSYFWLLQSLISTSPQNAQLLFAKIQRVARHRPDIESLYTLSCFVLALDYKRPDLCEPVIQYGMRAKPESWLIPATQGYMSGFALKDPLRAAYYYRKAAERPRCPSYIAGLSQTMLETGLRGVNAGETLKVIIEGLEDADFRDFLKSFLEQHRSNQP
ncbi:MAG: hypothetical protein HYW48_05990 [Deltaproteobacteria bacterium]|nr:hypothetical protein [Deltaproteobacteria bacterium]